MNLSLQKRLAADVLKCSPKRVVFDSEHLSDISEAITKNDIRDLIKQGLILKLQKKGVSRGRARIVHIQKKKGRRSGQGSRKGKHSARIGGSKKAWILKVRSQRKSVFQLKDEESLDLDIYHKLYRMVKGGFFRSRRHILIYLRDSGVIAPERFEELLSRIKKKNKRSIEYTLKRLKIRKQDSGKEKSKSAKTNKSDEVKKDVKTEEKSDKVKSDVKKEEKVVEKEVEKKAN